MQYVLMIHEDPALAPAPGAAGFEEMMAGYYGFNAELERRGIKYTGNPLQPLTTATTVRVRSGKTTITDGPFAETKEWMSGYFVVDCKDLDEALELAALIPGAGLGSVEVRPVAQYDELMKAMKERMAGQA